jgi:hypothetical protein
MPTLSESRFPHVQRHERSGQRQRGIDIFGRPNQGESWEGVQVKGKNGYFGERVTEMELRGEAVKAKEFRPPIKNFILVTSGQRDASIQEVARQLTEEHMSQGLFSVNVWGWEDIEERLPRFPEVIRELYPQYQMGPYGEGYSGERPLAGDLVSPERIERIEELIQELVQRHGTKDLGLAPTMLPQPDYPPLNPSIYAPRTELIAQILSGLQEGSWLALFGSTGTGKTLLAKSIWETQAHGAKCWISLRGQDGQYGEHLDRQLSAGWWTPPTMSPYSTSIGRGE